MHKKIVLLFGVLFLACSNVPSVPSSSHTSPLPSGTWFPFGANDTYTDLRVSGIEEYVTLRDLRHIVVDLEIRCSRPKGEMCNTGSLEAQLFSPVTEGGAVLAPVFDGTALPEHKKQAATLLGIAGGSTVRGSRLVSYKKTERVVALAYKLNGSSTTTVFLSVAPVAAK